MGDGFAQIVAGFVGGPPVTSYGENIGVLAITRVHSVFVIGGAAVLAVLLGFVGKLRCLDLEYPKSGHFWNQLPIVRCHCCKRDENLDRQ